VLWTHSLNFVLVTGVFVLPHFRQKSSDDIRVGAQAVINLGMHGTVEWLPGLPLGNDRKSWTDSLLDGIPNIYAYLANNPSESILATRRGYGTLVGYNVPPYGRAVCTSTWQI
jgi:cobalamin biosynthesis Mg chelatase CobN